MSTDDRAAIQNVISTYTNCINRRDWSPLPIIFADGAVWEAPALPISFDGKEAILQGIPAMLAATDILCQLNTPSVITIDGDHAAAQCSIRETGSIVREGIRFEAHGIYDDKLVKTEAGWQFARRTFTLLDNYFTELQAIDFNPMAPR